MAECAAGGRDGGGAGVCVGGGSVKDCYFYLFASCLLALIFDLFFGNFLPRSFAGLVNNFNRSIDG